MTLKHEFATPDCKSMGLTRACLVFKIGQPNGGMSTKTVEVSLDELKQLKKELSRIEETLS